MNNPAPAPIAVSLITGFLGSGKTTYLKHVRTQYQGHKRVYLINDFGKLGVDTQLLAATDPNVVSIPGGSIFCQCLVTEFVATLRRVLAEWHTTTAPVEGVVIEASGIANPKVIADMLRETRLDRFFRLTSIVALADPASFTKLLQTLPNIRAQIEAADLVLINKADLHAEERLQETEAAVRTIKPEARLLRTTFSRVSLDLFAEQDDHTTLHGDYAPCRDPHYISASVMLEAPLRIELLENATRSAGGFLYRAKGFVPLTDRVIYFDYSQSGIRTEPVTAPPAERGLVFIAQGDAQSDLNQLVARLQGGEFNA